MQANKLFLCRNDVQAIAFLRKGSYAPELGEDDGPQTMGNAKWEKAIDYSDVTNENQNHESRKIVNSEENCDFPSRLLNQNTVVIINLYDIHSLFCVRKSLVFR
jgi:hypothetical protein